MVVQPRFRFRPEYLLESLRLNIGAIASNPDAVQTHSNRKWPKSSLRSRGSYYLFAAISNFYIFNLTIITITFYKQKLGFIVAIDTVFNFRILGL